MHSWLTEFLRFLRFNKSWWLAPLFIALAILAVLVFFAHGSALAPFMYSH